MNDPRQTAFLNRVRNALNPPPRRPDIFAADSPETVEERLRKIQSRTPEDYRELLDRLKEAAAPINLRVVECKDADTVSKALAELVREKDPEWGTEKRVAAWDHPLIRSLDLPEALAGQNVPFTFTQPVDPSDGAEQRSQIRRQVEDAYIGITAADFCVVASATLAMKTRPGHARSVSLVPSIHVAVIEISRLLADLGELYTLLNHDPEHRAEGLTNCMTFISGPSKTADIEFTMVHGAHGPREVHLLVITQCP